MEVPPLSLCPLVLQPQIDLRVRPPPALPPQPDSYSMYTIMVYI